MKLSSPYLNPFQPFPERKLDGTDQDRPGSAIENNMSRAVFSALAHPQSPSALASFLERLAQDTSASVRDRIDDVIRILREPATVEVHIGLQSWPTVALEECQSLQILLIGISSSHQRVWTHDQRLAAENPSPDAWIYVPGRFLLVFECKNDEHALDATQISVYARALGLLTEEDCVPQPRPGETLDCAADAKKVQEICQRCLLDTNWSTVVTALKHLQQQSSTGSLAQWLCNQAAEYIGWHTYPPYRGVATILDWLNGPDTPDRRTHSSSSGRTATNSGDSPAWIVQHQSTRPASRSANPTSPFRSRSTPPPSSPPATIRTNSRSCSGPPSPGQPAATRKSPDL